MPTPVYQMIAIRPARGGTVHATSLTNPRRTACGRNCDGWVVAPLKVSWPAKTRAETKAHIGCRTCKRDMFRELDEAKIAEANK